MSLEEIIKLNHEYKTATPSRKEEIIRQIILLSPKVDDSITTATQQLNESLKEELNKLQTNVSSYDMQQYIKSVQLIQDQIIQHAQQLGVELTKHNLQEFQHLLDDRINK